MKPCFHMITMANDKCSCSILSQRAICGKCFLRSHDCWLALTNVVDFDSTPASIYTCSIFVSELRDYILSHVRSLKNLDMIKEYWIKRTTVLKDMFRHAYAIFSLIEWQVIRDTSYILHNMNKLLQYELQNSETGNYKVKKVLKWCNCLLRSGLFLLI